MFEFEKKIMITQQQYDCLRYQTCKNDPGDFQVNYYFDTDDFSMNRRGITCRLRCKNGIYKATIKNHGIKNANCSIEEDLTEKTHFDINAFSFLGIHLQGDLVTERIVMYKDCVCEIVLDRNIYLGTTDYELEIEYLEGYENQANILLDEILNTLLLNHAILNKDDLQGIQGRSKSERFFERKRMQGGQGDELCFGRNCGTEVRQANDC